MIELKNITKTYQMGETSQTVLHGINVSIKDSELVAIMGPSGSGKSTLMNIIGVLDRPTSGEYYLKNKKVSTLDDDELAATRNEMIGFVFQQFFLLPRLTALQNVMLPLSYRGTEAKEAQQKAMSMLDKVGVSDRSQYKPSQLSGGQQQRVAVARALVGDPKVILADEPTGALDSTTGKEVMDLFLSLNEENTTVIIVTHDPLIGAQCKRIINIKDGLVV